MRTAALGLSDASDDHLLWAARAGDRGAFDELYGRHRGAALRLARSYRHHGDPEDLVSSAFEKVLAALLRGNGPTDSFRAYLFVTLRRLAAESGRHPVPEPLDIVPETVLAVSGLPGLDEAERAMITQAFEALPDRWQAVLWSTAVEGRHPREVARSAGIPANTVSVLAHRARERLRENYLQAHLRASPVAACEPHRSRLGGYVRGGLGRRHRRATVEHLEACPSCRDLVIELTDVNRQLVRSVLPLFVLASGGTIARQAAGAAGVTGAAAGAGAGASAAGSAGISGVAGAGTAAGAGVSAVKVAVAAAAAVVALTVSLVPDLGGRGDGDGPQAFAAGGPPGFGESATTSTAPAGDRSGPPSEAPGTAAEAQPPADVDTGTDVGPSAPPADATPPATGTGGAGGELVDVEVGVDAGPVLDVDAGVEVGPGVELDASWASSLPGAGTLRVHVQNPAGGTVSAVTVDIQLSPHARATTLLSSGCEASDPGLVGVVLSLVDALTCTLGNLAAGAGATIDVPLHVSAPGQTATVVLRAGDEVLDRTVVALPPG